MGRKMLLFCSSINHIAPKYHQAARELVRAACLRGYELVSGGTVKGTMGVIADEARKCGCRHTGVLPFFMEDVRYPGLSEVIMTETMSERKARMREGVSVAVALPGGIGTLDELIELLVLIKLGRSDARLFALDVDGFYEPLKQLLDHYVRTGMMTAAERELIAFPKTVEELMAQAG